MARKKFFKTDNAKSTILIRLMVGAVFLSEGIQKFLFPSVRGAGRFEGIGLPVGRWTITGGSTNFFN